MLLQEQLKAVKALILDMDGVLWRDNQAIGNLPEIFSTLETRNIKSVLATNNSTRTIKQYQNRVQSFGVELEPWQIVTSGQAAANLLKHRYPSRGNVFVVGEDALMHTLREAGFNITETDVDIVVAGMDRELTYSKIRQAARFIRSGAAFIGTNPDRTFPTPEGLVPGAGVVLAAIQTATDIAPEIAGKPSPAMYQLALQRLDVHPEETLVVGDRPETDIAGGQQLGCLTALVLSGVTTQTGAEEWQPKPDIIAADLTEVIQILIQNRHE
jgi:4-nitrophenyl phosphatase